MLEYSLFAGLEMTFQLEFNCLLLTKRNFTSLSDSYFSPRQHRQNPGIISDSENTAHHTPPSVAMGVCDRQRAQLSLGRTEGRWRAPCSPSPPHSFPVYPAQQEEVHETSSLQLKILSMAHGSVNGILFFPLPPSLSPHTAPWPLGPPF